MKKIIHIINGLNQGGSERALFRLLKTLYEDYHFYIIVLDKPGFYSEKIEELGIPVQHLYISKNPIKALFSLIKYLREIKPDVVQTWLYHADLIGGIAAKLCKVNKIIWGIRCEGIHLKKTTQFIKQSCALLSKKIPHHIVANSRAAANNHIQSGYHAAKMQIIYNGFDSQEVTNHLAPHLELYPEKSMLSKKPIMKIGTLARFHPDKDYATLIQAIDIICRSQPHIHFVFCGPGCHEENRELTTLIDKLEYAHHITLLNGVEDTPAYLNTLDIFVQSSKTESFSNSLAEAMLCGLPCVATNVGETRTICGDYAVLISKENPEKLASACLAMLKKPQSERIQLGQLARNYIEQTFSIDCYKTNFQNLYEKD